MAFYTFCYWQIFWHSIWHIFWHPIWHSIWQIFWHSIWQTFWHFIWHTLWHSIWHNQNSFYLAYLLAFYLAYLLAFYLTCYLPFYLAYLLAFYLAVEVQRCSLSSEGPRLRSSGAHWAGKVPGWAPEVFSELGRSQAEVQRCPLRSHAAVEVQQCPLRAEVGEELARRKWTWEWMQRWRRRCWRTRRRKRSRRRKRRTALIKSNNPHLAGGNNEKDIKTFWEEHNVCACTLTSPSACDTLARVGGVLGQDRDLKLSTSQSRQFLKSLPAIDAIGTAEITWTSGCDGKGLTCATV